MLAEKEMQNILSHIFMKVQHNPGEIGDNYNQHQVIISSIPIESAVS
jgi:hypothetical protein